MYLGLEGFGCVLGNAACFAVVLGGWQVFDCKLKVSFDLIPSPDLRSQPLQAWFLQVQSGF